MLHRIFHVETKVKHRRRSIADDYRLKRPRSSGAFTLFRWCIYKDATHFHFSLLRILCVQTVRVSLFRKFLTRKHRDAKRRTLLNSSLCLPIINMRTFLLIFFVTITAAIAEKDESWTWHDKEKTSRTADARCAIDSIIYQR